MNETFKVFEWSIEFTNGAITDFEPGMTKEDYNVIMQVNQLIFSQMLGGGIDFGIETITPWINQGLIKINPFTEVMRIATLLPQIFSELSKEE